ncbi:MAG TPA: SRPBCC domain-containing protein [Streptosporangiaceae bacterium]|nr:SRPBCC domain-containing protein [Streptosporangiaceae bacterium]
MAQDWIERDVIIDASRERVWAVLTEADHVARWFGDSAEIDARPGGRARFGWTGEGVYRAIVEEVAEPSAFSFRWAQDPGSEPKEGTGTMVEFTLTEVPVGTLLRVVETGFAGLHVSEAEQAKAAEKNRRGWAVELAQLKEYAERALR